MNEKRSSIVDIMNLRSIQPNAAVLDDTPLLGFLPPFSWEEFSKNLQELLQIEKLHIEPGNIQWRDQPELFQGLGDFPLALNFTIPGCEGTVSFVIPEQEIVLLIAYLLHQEELPITAQDRSFIEGFYRFIALETLFQIGKSELGKMITPLPSSSSELPSKPSLCIDFTIQLEEHNLTGRLFLSPEFRSSLKKLFKKNYFPSTETTIAQQATVILHLEVGKTIVSLQEWSTIRIGDFFILDSCSMIPGEKSGRILLTLNKKPIFRGKIREDGIKLLEIPQYQEVFSKMNAKKNDEDFAKEWKDEEDQEENFDEDFEDESEFEEEFEEEEQLEESPQQSETAPVVSEKTLQKENIPLEIVAELGRVEITVQKLLSLEPGNLLDLNIRPENNVDLTVNGRLIGKGELIRLGETVGVRILEVGS